MMATTHYLGKNGFAQRLGWKDGDSLSSYELPEPDALIDGTRKGWLPETADKFKASLPGRGARTDLAPPVPDTGEAVSDDVDH
jgi:hypothetical protein